jgi:hypothetical protein
MPAAIALDLVQPSGPITGRLCAANYGLQNADGYVARLSAHQFGRFFSSSVAGVTVAVMSITCAG